MTEQSEIKKIVVEYLRQPDVDNMDKLFKTITGEEFQQYTQTKIDIYNVRNKVYYGDLDDSKNLRILYNGLINGYFTLDELESKTRTNYYYIGERILSLVIHLNKYYELDVKYVDGVLRFDRYINKCSEDYTKDSYLLHYLDQLYYYEYLNYPTPPLEISLDNINGDIERDRQHTIKNNIKNKLFKLNLLALDKSSVNREYIKQLTEYINGQLNKIKL